MKKLKAKDIMTKQILKVEEDWSIQRLAEFFIENSISGAPVTSTEGKLVGVVSLTDIILNGTLPEKDPQSYEPHEYYMDDLERQYAREEISFFQIRGEPLITIHDIMTPTIFKVTENTSVQKVAEIMIKNCIHRVFVTRGEKMLGIISTVDMLKIIRDV